MQTDAHAGVPQRTPQILRVSLTNFISSSLYPFSPILVVWLNRLNAYCAQRHDSPQQMHQAGRTECKY